MKKIFTFITILMTMFVSKGQNVVEFSYDLPWVGYSNVFDHPNDGGGYLWGSAWAVEDLQSIVDSTGNSLTLYPNFSTYSQNLTDPYWVNQVSGEGNKVLEASTYVEFDSTYNNIDLLWMGNVEEFTIDTSKYKVNVFIKALDPSNFWQDALLGSKTVPLTGTGNFSLSALASELPSGLVIQVGFNVIGLNADSALAGVLGNVKIAPPSNVIEFNTSENWIGYMNVFEVPSNGGAFAFGTAWGVQDLKSTFDTVYNCVKLQPNFNTYANNPTDPYWVNQTTLEGNKEMEASTYLDLDTSYNGHGLVFEGYVQHLTIDTTLYDVNFFIKALDPSNSWQDALGGSKIIPITSTGYFSISATAAEMAPGLVLQVGFNVIGTNANPADEAMLGSVVIGSGPDTVAPVPLVASLPGLMDMCPITPIAPKALDKGDTIVATTMTSFPISELGTTVVTWTYTDGAGNTSMQNQNVTISGVTKMLTESACESYMSPSGKTYTMSNTYIDTLIVDNDCDTIYTINLTINSPSDTMLTETACDSFSFAGITRTSTGMYYDTLMNQNGCDSIVTLDLTINNSASTMLTISACNSYDFGGQTITMTGIYYDTLMTSTNCDSIVTLDLTITTFVETNLTETACDSYEFGGETLTMTGIYRDTLSTGGGCDSIIILDLTINGAMAAITLNGETLVADSAESYEWLDCNNSFNIISGETGMSYSPTTSGSYAVLVYNNGCADTSACTEVMFDGIEDFENSVRIYPNPTNGTINIDVSQANNATIQVINAFGQLIMTQDNVATQQQLEIEGPAGIYFVKINSEDKTATFKVTKY